MTKDELLAKLAVIAQDGDQERAHGDADDALIEYINDPDVKAAYDDIDKWYA